MEIEISIILELMYLIIGIYTAGLTAGRLKLHSEEKLTVIELEITNLSIIYLSLICGFIWPIIYIISFIEWLKK